MKPFDHGEYRTTVLKPARQTGVLPDVFARYCLDVDDADDDAIQVRMDEVRAFWDKEKQGGNPTNAELIGKLLREHTKSAFVLKDPQKRRATAAQIQASQREARETQESQFRSALEYARRSSGGLTPSQYRQLKDYASSLPLVPDDLVIGELDRCTVLSEPSQVAALPDHDRRRITETLADLALARGERRIASLYHAIGLLQATTDVTLIEKHYVKVEKEHGQMSHDAAGLTALGTVLALVNMHLRKGDGAYLATFREEVQAQLRPEAIKLTVDDGRIDALEAASLVTQAIESGLDADAARQVVTRLAADMKVSLEFGAPSAYVRCAHCARPHGTPDTPEFCTGCSQPMFHLCPNCGKRCPSSDEACAGCGCDLSVLVDAERLVLRGRDALANHRPATALDAAEAARNLCAELPGQALGVDELERAARASCEHAMEAWGEIESALADAKVYSARRRLMTLCREAEDVVGPHGSVPSARVAELDARVRAVDRALGAARTAQGREREEQLTRVLELASDSEEAAGELARIAPGPPRGVRVNSTAKGVHLSWDASTSPGRVAYRVCRSHVAGATSRGGEEVVGTTSALELQDPGAVAGATVSYSVVSVRASASSAPTRTPPTLVASEVEDLRASERDAEVRLSWTPARGSGAVHVERTESENPAARVALKAAGSGIVDRDVRNGQGYRYRVFVEYAASDGTAVATPGQYVLAAPAARPEAIRDLSISHVGGQIRLRWTEPRYGTVEIHRCDARPSFAPGGEVTAQELADLGSPLRIDSDGGCASVSARSVVWYLPVTIAGSYRIAGAAIRHVGLPEITDVRAVDLSTSVRVTWVWPSGINEACVTWRLDAGPTGPDDDGVESMRVTRAQYSDGGGVTVTAPPPASFVSISVYAVTRVDGESVVGTAAGSGSGADVRRGTRVDVIYSVRRTGPLNRKLELVVSTPSRAADLPALVLIAKRGTLLPRSASDGRAIARLGGEGGLPVPHRLDLRDIARPVALRLFLADTAAMNNYRVRDPNTSELILS